MNDVDIRWQQRLSNYRRALSQLHGSRDATLEAFQLGLLEVGDIWMGMIKSRNQSAHTYNKDTADEISGLILSQYFTLFKAFEQKMVGLPNGH